MNTDLSIELSKVSKPQLVEFVQSLYGMDKQLDQRIERLLAVSDPKKLAALFKKSISSLNRRSAFVAYGEAYALGSEIEQLANDIFTQLLPLSADLATELLEKLMATGVKSIERCDDSGGYVGGVYQDMVVLWLQAAAKTEQDHSVWIQKIKAFKDSDDYSLFDDLLPNLNLLLNSDEMRQLAFYYETELRRSNDNWQGLQASANVNSMAQALGDCELMERGLLYHSPEPNTMQLASLIRFCLEQGDNQRALKWLNSKNEHSPAWLILKINSFQSLGLNEELPSLCEQLLERQANLEHLHIAIKACPEQAKTWQKKALDLLPKLDVVGQIELLLSLEQFDQALTIALSNYTELREVYYGSLIRLIEATHEHAYLLQVILYRCLLLDLLDRSYAKAYRHGARYLKTLRALDDKVVDYASLDSHLQLETYLQEKHGRKRSFWALV